MTSHRPEIGARLDHLCLRSPDPRRLAAFFERACAMSATSAGERILCAAPGRRILIEPGPAHSTGFFAYALPDPARLAAYREQLAARGLALRANPSPLYDGRAFAVTDPDGNQVVFGHGEPAAEPAPGCLPARLQHVVFRTAALEAMVEFYEQRLGYVASDRVRDGGGVLRACFLRTDLEHHSLALFRSPETRLDHHSYETRDWEHIRVWADDFSAKRIPIFWGVGRHGPGNDLFFMVKDPDDNLVEISAEIEQCAPDRPTGIWPHEERTLNVWGQAIMRS